MNTAEYEALIDSKVEELHDLASDARSRREDPKPEVESDIANDIAGRCEKLLGIPGLEGLIIELEEEGYGREEMAFEIAEEFATGEVGDFESDDEKVEAAIRTAIALLTEGVVAAPIDGIGEVKIETNDDGSDFIRVPYFGPIRSAGGTGQALSVLVADHIRQELGISKFQPREDEVHRYVEEMQLYEQTTGLQYTPKEKEVKHIVQNCPIMIDGIQTEDKEVGGYRDLERIEGNKPRGGMCLVVGEGIAQKAPKIQRYVDSVGIEGWGWIDELVEGLGKKDSSSDADDSDEETVENDAESDEDVASDGGADRDMLSIPLSMNQGNEFEPKTKFKSDTIIGRPIFADGGTKGSFRLRYGRSRNTGIAASGFNPATMVIVDEFIATGTQIKTERPGKAQGAVPVTHIEGPTVKLFDGTVTQINTEERARELNEKVEEIIDLGEMLVSYGEFLENNHDMAPAPWTRDWWFQEYLHAGGDPTEWGQDDDISFDEALTFSTEYDIPLHPQFSFYWSEIEPSAYSTLSAAIAESEHETNDDSTVTISVDEEIMAILEDLNVEHKQDEESVTMAADDYRALNLVCDTNGELDASDFDRTLVMVNSVSPVEIRKRVTLRIGARMGRPEKSKLREMDDKVINALVPVGDAGKHKDLISAADDGSQGNQSFKKNSDEYKGRGVINAQLSHRNCPACDEETWKIRCPDCGERTEELLSCYQCSLDGHEHDASRGDECPNPKCDGKIISYRYQDFDIGAELETAFDNLPNTRKSHMKNVKAVEGLSSATKIVEPLEKGILRAKYELGTFRDGTSRFDMVDLPLTHFNLEEANMSVEQAHELGYTEDMNGDPVEDTSQTVELQKQDMIISDTSAEYMLRVSQFIDELLEQYYGMEPFYDADTEEDLIGQLVAGLAPHTSAAVVGRIVGFADIKAHYAHPVYHAAKRRNCFAYDTTLTYYDEDGVKQESAIGDFVEANLDGSQVVDAYGTEVADVSSTVAVETKSESDGTVTQNQIAKVQRSPAPSHLLEVEFDDGSTVQMTRDHEVIAPASTDGTARVRAEHLQTGDVVYTNQMETTDPESARTVRDITRVEYDGEFVYCLEIENVHNFGVEGVQVANCDGDEDSIMLLLDGFLNFSQEYLPDRRGARSMDAPLLMTSIIDPEEIDDEAHNVTTQGFFPIEYYYQTHEKPGPKEMDIPIIEDMLDGDDGILGIKYTTETDSIDAGPKTSMYNILGDSEEKADAQLKLASRTRAIEEQFVATKVIEKHIIPDFLGNINAFTKMEFMCNHCYNKHPFPPFDHKCKECGSGSLRGTMAEGMVTKYIDFAIEVADTYGLEPYLQQRLEVLESRAESLFENDKNKQAGLGDFM